jgi:xanthine dehydrogenase accessory factor
MKRGTVVVRGGGDIATGTIYRLHQIGYNVLVLETEQPTVIRRTVAFAQCVFDGKTMVEETEAVLCKNKEEIYRAFNRDQVAVTIDPRGKIISEIQLKAVVDAILAKRNLGTSKNMAPVVIGLGPGFEAGTDVDAVIETNRGHDLGRVIYSGRPHPDTGIPGNIAGETSRRVLRAPCEGKIQTLKEIGDLVKKGEIIAQVEDMVIRASLDGVIRGMIYSGTPVTEGFKIGDIDPRGDATCCYSISDKARNIAGAVVEVILRAEYLNNEKL